MLTLAGDEAGDGNHYQDFLETLAFLYGRGRGREVAAALEREMRAFRGFLQTLLASHDDALRARETIEDRLRQVMARTERVSSTLARVAMASEQHLEIRVDQSDVEPASSVTKDDRAPHAPSHVQHLQSAGGKRT